MEEGMWRGARERRGECGQVYWVTRSMREPRERRCYGSTSAPLREFSLSLLSIYLSNPSISSLFSPLFPMNVHLSLLFQPFHDAAECAALARSFVRSFVRRISMFPSLAAVH